MRLDRWLPRSLFSRLVVVLLVVLFVAQLASFALHMVERVELMEQTSGIQSAQRIADVVHLLDPMSPAERARVAGAVTGPGFAVNLDRPPLNMDAAGGGMHTTMFGAVLRRFVGDGFPVVVGEIAVPSEAIPAERRPRGMGGEGGPPPWAGGMHAGGRGAGGPRFLAQVRLTDGALVTFDTRQPEQAATRPYRLLGSIVLLLVAVIGVSLLAVRWATRPLETLAAAADELGRDINRPPLAEDGPTEVARAARAFNAMQARLAGFIAERTRVLAAMSHDLKTPITRLRLRAELLDDETLRTRFTRDLEEMESMVTEALEFLRGIDGREPVRPIDVTALLESLQADFRETGGTVTIEGASRSAFPGRTQTLKRCLSNLIDNAIRYGGAARILVDDAPNALRIRVVDRGPGLPPTELEKVFEPFYRLEGSRNRESGGTGLGLAIARAIAQLHGGTLVLRNAEGGGLEAVLTLPRGAEGSEIRV